MSDEQTINEQAAEIERLRAKNAELLDKLAKAKEATRTDNASVEELQARLKTAEDELHTIKYANPRRDFIRQYGYSEDHSDAAMREIERFYTIADDGTLLDKEGKPAKIETRDDNGNVIKSKSLHFDIESLKLIGEKKIPVLSSLMRFTLATGGGAGGAGEPTNGYFKPDTRNEKQPDNTPKFGIR